MNNFIVEQLKVQEMIKRINPDMEANYEGMMQVLQKSNPLIIVGKVSHTFKRIMYLQLISHSVSESCSMIKEIAYDRRKVEQINDFQKSVEDFCKGFVDGNRLIENQETFEHNQRIASEMFLYKWNEITQCLSLHDGQESFAFIQ